MSSRSAARRRARGAPRRIEYRRPPLAQYQTDAIFCEERYATIEATTKAGKTVGCIAWLTERACLRGTPGWQGAWVAPIYRQAAIAYMRFKRFADPRFFKANDSRLELRFPNGALIRHLGADNPDSIYGEDYNDAVIDEASRTKEEAYHAVRSTLTATRGALRMIGNVKGTRNWFYALARQAEAGEPGMRHAKITAIDAVRAGILALAEVEDARRMLPEAVFLELYMGIPREDGANPFGHAAIAACLAADPAEIRAMAQATPVIYGIDLAKASDWTVIIGLDAAGRVCRFHRFQKPWRETMQEIRRLIGQTPALIDSTGVGDPIVELLQAGLLPADAPAGPILGQTMSGRIADEMARRALTSEERQREAAGLMRACPNIRGFVFTSTSKQQLMERLALVIQNREIRLVPGPGNVLRNELDSFEFHYTPGSRSVRYRAPEGQHDDTVMALALAVEGRAFAVRTDYAGGAIVTM